MALSQMNIRIDDRVRIEGNGALESVGLTPARAVRGLWGFAARNRGNPARIRQALRFLDEPDGADAERIARARAIEEGWSTADEGIAALGVSVGSAKAIPLAELKEQAYRERWEARGLL